MTALKDKRAIITAGASGIGRVVAKKMIAAGAK
ncbi:3-oxoacyl-[acyl-carrier-protein] reductase, partial [Mesorhizobium sp. M2A.F.Ca.ET.039.01.1.1]